MKANLIYPEATWYVRAARNLYERKEITLEQYSDVLRRSKVYA